MTELLVNKIDKLIEKFTAMETNITLLHTEINNVKEEIKINTQKPKVKNTYGITK